MLINKVIYALTHRPSRFFVPVLLTRAIVLLAMSVTTMQVQAIPAQSPLSLSQAVTPIMMLNMSKDHQLYFKAYDDYTDLTDTNVKLSNGDPNPNFLKNVGDGKVTKKYPATGTASIVDETTYMHGYEYYGYFDSKKCYTYRNDRFEPTSLTNANGYCSGTWNGNFLNWGTMTRMDVIRKILYGGLRSTDDNTNTVLERAFLPTDAHAFAKYYNGTDINQLTPFSDSPAGSFPMAGTVGIKETGITLCNVSNEADSGYSQKSKELPLIRVAKGNYSLWASNERFQCRWMATSSFLPGINKNSNSSDLSQSGVPAYDVAPTRNTSKDKGQFNVLVKVCSEGFAEDNCQQYPSASFPNKPIGLLQKYGETDELHFGLITGSFGRNKSGGVLRKNVGNMRDEINTGDYGTFKTAPASGGIINTINKLRLYGYDYNKIYDNKDNGYEGTYHYKDSCTNSLTTFPDGNCSNWGNPQSEIYYESLRYLAGVKATPEYIWSTNPDTNYIEGLTIASWSAPITENKGNYCAPLSILQFNASSSSYDDASTTNYPDLNDIGLAGITNLKTYTYDIGVSEGIQGTNRFVGKINGSGDQLCTAKKITSLSEVSGICPDSPRLDGGYTVAGLAKFARTTGINLNGIKPSYSSKVRTYGVALAPAVPKVEIPVPNGSGKKIIIQPACRNQSTKLNGQSVPTNCAIVDFKIVEYIERTKFDNRFGNEFGTYGKLYVNWEDSEQGFDYDQDMWGTISYLVTETGKVYVETRVYAQSGGDALGFGYVLSGTDSDGFKVHSGVNRFSYSGGCEGENCTCLPYDSSKKDNNVFGACTLAKTTLRTYNVSNSNALSGTFMESPLYYAAKWGGYDRDFEKANSENGELEDAIKNRTPSDSFFFATSPKALADQLAVAFETIRTDVPPSSGVATNNPRLSNDAFLFQTKFSTSTWAGELEAIQFDNTGKLIRKNGEPNGEPVVATSTSLAGKIAAPNTRRVYTNVSSPYATGSLATALSWSTLNSAQQTLLKNVSDNGNIDLAKNRVDWLKGDDAKEIGKSDGVFRSRTIAGKRNVLGDTVNSRLVHVSNKEDYNFDRLPIIGVSYRQYVANKSTKKSMLFIGANDGMMHAFDASYTIDASGVASTTNLLKEVYAYIPQIAFSDGKLAKITQANYGTTSNPHQYIVDGPHVSSDVYINNQWRTVVVGTLGAGGRGIYALDVTDTLSDFTKAPKVLFEISNTTCKTTDIPCKAADIWYPQIGYVMGAPVIAPTTSGRFVVIFGNGDTQDTPSPQMSSLFVIDLEAPFDSTYSRVIRTITDQNATIANAGAGLSAPEVLPNSVGQAIGVYAGDLSGNLWHFNLSGAVGNVLAASEVPSAENWSRDYLLFKATATSGGSVPANTAQPIFAAPTLGFNLKNNKYMVYFGTGKYYDTGDNAVSTNIVHSIYAIADMSVAGVLAQPVSRSDLEKKALIGSNRAEDPSFQPDWKEDQGWYLDLPDAGERITTTPLLIDDTLVFATLIPKNDLCDTGGDSWIMGLKATGAFTLTHPTLLDSNVKSQGLILGDLGSGRRADGSGSVLGSRTKSDGGGIVEEKMNLEPGLVGRQSWRQLR